MSMDIEMNEQPYFEKIVSGTVGYCNKIVAEYRARGYVVASQKQWSDGKYTFVLRKDK
jgi:hypothetical protein